MSSKKTTCKKCGTSILQTTANYTGGVCRPCKKFKIGSTEVAEGMEISLRMILAVVFAVFFSIIGYGLASLVWIGFGVIFAIILFPLGAIYGFFCSEINFFLRSILRSILHFDL